MDEVIRVYTVSLGCPKNRVDTERLLGGLGAHYQPVESPEAAQVLLINTCGFLQAAVEESLDTIMDMVRLAQEAACRPLVVVTGCLVARYGAEVLRQELPEVDLVVDIAGQRQLPEDILRYFGLQAAPAARVVSTPASFAYLKIAEGCSNRCRFCTIPSIRGGVRGRPVEELVAEASVCVAAGRRELVLVAQDVTAYGQDLGMRRGLAQLLEALVRVPGLSWLRLMYLYPSGLTEDLLAVMRDLGGPVLPYFDIPFQHAHPEILAAMGRPFRTQDPWAVVERVRRYFPHAALRTSLIVGYPGEADAHFAALESFVAEAEFTHVGVFAFSPEEGTPAATLKGQVPLRVRQRRRRRIMALQRRLSRRYLARFRDQELDILVDQPSTEWPGLFEGRTWFQAPEVDGVAYVSGPRVRAGALVRARVEDTHDYDLVTLAGDSDGEEVCKFKPMANGGR